LKRLLLKAHQDYTEDEIDEEERISHTEEESLTFDERRNIIDEFYRKNIDVLSKSKVTMFSIEAENERQRKHAIEHNHKIIEIKWRFFRYTNDKLKSN
jgi:hypothetical protein